MGHLDATVRPDSRGLQGRLLDRGVTIAQVLKPAGYYTGMAGKWHLGSAQRTPPTTKGFDRSVSFPPGVYFRDQPTRKRVVIDGRPFPLTAPAVGPPGWYGSHLLAD